MILSVDIAKEIPQYRKKRPSSVSKAKEKANHRHTYLPCILRLKWGNAGDCGLTGGRFCSTCGKITLSMRFFENHDDVILNPKGYPVFDYDF